MADRKYEAIASCPLSQRKKEVVNEKTKPSVLLGLMALNMSNLFNYIPAWLNATISCFLIIVTVRDVRINWCECQLLCNVNVSRMT